MDRHICALTVFREVLDNSTGSSFKRLFLSSKPEQGAHFAKKSVAAHSPPPVTMSSFIFQADATRLENSPLVCLYVIVAQIVHHPRIPESLDPKNDRSKSEKLLLLNTNATMACQGGEQNYITGRGLS